MVGEQNCQTEETLPGSGKLINPSLKQIRVIISKIAYIKINYTVTYNNHHVAFFFFWLHVTHNFFKQFLLYYRSLTITTRPNHDKHFHVELHNEKFYSHHKNVQYNKVFAPHSLSMNYKD